MPLIKIGLRRGLNLNFPFISQLTQGERQIKTKLIQSNHWQLTLAAILIILAFLGLTTVQSQVALADAPGSEVAVQAPSAGNPPVLPPNSNPFGKSYREWAARWWQWYFSIPAPVHPVADESGVNCAQGQSGKVWFLAGAATGEAERTCQVPNGKAILFPIINAECSTVEPDPFHGDNEAELRACVEAIGFSDADELTVTIDGQVVENLLRYRIQSTQSPLFDFTLPDDDILGVDATQGQAVAGGYYVMLPPLSRGEHVVYFKGVLKAGPFGGFSQEVTYHLTIGK